MRSRMEHGTPRAARREASLGVTWDPDARLLTIEEAGRSVGRPQSTVRRWLSEGRLTPTAWLGPRRPLILESDVLACDADTVRRSRGVVGGV